MYAHEVISGLNYNAWGVEDASFKDTVKIICEKISNAQKFHIGFVGDVINSNKGMIGKQYFMGNDYIFRPPYRDFWLDWRYSNNGEAFWHSDAEFGGMYVRWMEETVFAANLFGRVGKREGWLIFPFTFLVSVGCSFSENCFCKNEDYFCGMPLENKTGNVAAFEMTCDKRVNDAIEENNIIEKIVTIPFGALQSFLTLLNCKNISTVENDPPTKLNKSRIKKGKQPLFTYKTLVIKPTSKRQQSLEAQGLWENRIHLCRGHFKEYTQDKPLFGKFTGRYWWQPSVRGRSEKGVVLKDYELRSEDFKEAA